MNTVKKKMLILKFVLYIYYLRHNQVDMYLYCGHYFIKILALMMHVHPIFEYKYI